MTDRVLRQLMTRAECLDWAKARALALLPGRPIGALASFVRDLEAHPALADHPALAASGMLLREGTLTDPEQVSGSLSKDRKA
jgi:hypothetical protein